MTNGWQSPGWRTLTLPAKVVFQKNWSTDNHYSIRNQKFQVNLKSFILFSTCLLEIQWTKIYQHFDVRFVYFNNAGTAEVLHGWLHDEECTFKTFQKSPRGPLKSKINWLNFSWIKRRNFKSFWTVLIKKLQLLLI